MRVKIKKLHKDAVVPAYAREGDAGMDLTAIAMDYDEYGNLVIKTGLAIEIPYGFAGFIFPRSSISKTPFFMSNSIGVIDAGYRGEVTIKYKEIDANGYLMELIETGKKVAQLIIMPHPHIEFDVVDKLSESMRGEGGFGSTGV